MKKFILNLFLLLIVVFLAPAQKVQAFWKLPFDIKIGNQPGSIEKNQYYQMRQEAQKAVDSLVSAYETKKVSRFMNFVNEDFSFSGSDIESAIRQDFFKYSYIDMNVFINNVVKSSDGKLAVSLNYRRTLEDRTARKMVSDSGYTELILKKEDNAYKLYSMKKPYLFGVSGN